MNYIATQNNNYQPACTCPHCNSTCLIRFGFDRGTQRYRCKSCRKTFKATAGTPAHGLHKKEKIDRYLIALRKGMSIRKAARYASISKNTSFAWRHKFLSSLEARSVVQTTNPVATAEIIQLEYSAKGRRKPPEEHTSPTITIALYRDRQMELHKLKQIKRTWNTAKVLSKNTAKYFVAPPHRTLTLGIKHSGNATKIKNQQVSRPLIAEVKQQTETLLNWMERFKGVASKYLQNYWNWYASLLNLNQLKQETEYFNTLCINSRNLAQYYILKNK